MNDKDGLGPSQHAYVVSQPGNKLNFSFLVELPAPSPPLTMLGERRVIFLFSSPGRDKKAVNTNVVLGGGAGAGRN